MRAPLALLSLVLGGCAIGALATRQRSTPSQQGQLAVEGLGAGLTITRDGLGLPHIEAASDADAWFGLGFAQAQDRLFQMDATRRLVWGQLSEWSGERTLRMDRFFRGMDLKERSRQRYARLSPEVKAAVDAYSAGVNAGAAALPALPVEHRLIGQGFQAWEPVDSIAVLWVTALSLAENLSVESAALALREKVDARGMDALFRFDPTEPPVDPAWDELRRRDISPSTEDFAAFAEIFGYTPDAGASNNWVVAGSHSADGAPIVANDPHLSQFVPSLWYPVDLRAPGLHVTGMSMAGSPFVVIGHNEQIAWAFTNVMADFIDLAVLERQGDGYLWEGQVRPFTRRNERFGLRGGKSAEAELVGTHLGPLISSTEGELVVALRWSGLEVEDQSTTLFWELNRAVDVDGALAAVSRPTMIAQNLLVADRKGEIAWQPFGSFPKRVGHDGRLPRLTRGELWQGWLPPIAGERNPERGYIATANARPRGTEEAWRYSTRFINDARQRRIEELLAARPQHDATSLGQIQMDRKDLAALRLRPMLLEGVAPKGAAAQRCLGLIQGWDGVASPESVGAAAWYVFEAALIEVAVEDELGPLTSTYVRASLSGASLLERDLAHFLPDRPAGVELALGRACERLEAELGADPGRWTWGALHPLQLKHALGDIFGRWNLPEVAYGGSPNTVNAGDFRLGQWPAPTTTIASMRLIMPLSDLSQSSFSHPGGQSGMPRAEGGRDLWPIWLAGERRPLLDAPPAGAPALRLVPAPR